MTWFSALVLFIVIWWTTLFVVLPLWVHRQGEDDLVEGAEAGAPKDSFMKRKVWVTTGASVVIFIIIFSIIHFQLFTFDDIPFIPQFDDTL